MRRLPRHASWRSEFTARHLSLTHDAEALLLYAADTVLVRDVV
jgi:hypothetical protein